MIWWAIVKKKETKTIVEINNEINRPDMIEYTLNNLRKEKSCERSDDESN